MTKEESYNSIVSYVKEQLLERISHYISDYGAVTADIKDLKVIVPYSSYIEHISKGKKKVITGKYANEWKEWWALWPKTKSVPDTNMKSGAPMKKDEAKMYQKWLAIVDGGDTGIQTMYRAADCYLKWGYYDSIRKGKNELEVRSGMEPWLNQKQYLIYDTMEYPIQPKIEKQQVYQNTTDQ